MELADPALERAQPEHTALPETFVEERRGGLPIVDAAAPHQCRGAFDLESHRPKSSARLRDPSRGRVGVCKGVVIAAAERGKPRERQTDRPGAHLA